MKVFPQIPDDSHISSRSITYRIITIFFAVDLVIEFNTVIIKENSRGALERNSVFLYILSVFLRVILKKQPAQSKPDYVLRNPHKHHCRS